MKLPASLKLSRKGLLGLVYVAISLVLVGLSVEMTQGQVQWFASVASLNPTLSTVDFLNISARYNNGTVLVKAYLENPTEFNGFHVTRIEYAVFVSSTGGDTPVPGSSLVALSNFPYETSLPARGTMNLTYQFRILPDIASPLSNFLLNHTIDRVTFTLIAVTLQSSFGPLAARYCIQTPGGNITTCPSANI